ncbi:G-patch-domain-containing protein [Sporormia fimetaria CBS 119925]|uniref:G-patch-domain-containing protein n=1 Tax=Sporormia fimetaria CBS 119925 TaxID=1340428 RepID=A0A6A6VJB8_9PLEO|nr:G-patch-domain-containing protein [Sporormia fimetaria CBS 119925]
MAASDEEDDYMNMVFEETPKQKYETSLQRAALRRREAEERSRQKTKEERKADEAAAREAALTTALPSTNKGFKMMAKMGFKQGDALGKSENARREPIKVNIKEDKSGIGLESEKKRKFREHMEELERTTKKAKETELGYREAQRQEMKEKKLARDLANAQKAAERLHETADDSKQASEPPLKTINVLWRGPVRRRRQELHHETQMNRIRKDLLSRTSANDEDEDQDDKIALGRDTALVFDDDNLDEDDPELDAFESLSAEEQLDRVIAFLRDEYHYCFWCGHKYDDAAMEGCPGITEEEHE